MARILVGTECAPDRRPVAAASWRVASGPVGAASAGTTARSGTTASRAAERSRAGVDSWRSLTPDSAGGTLRVGGEDLEWCLGHAVLIFKHRPLAFP